MTKENRFDIAVGLVLPKGAQPPPRLVDKISEGLATYFSTFSWTLIHAHAGLSRSQPLPEIAGVRNQIPIAVPWAGIQHVTFPWHGLPAKTAGYQALLAQAECTGAQVCLIVDPSEDAFEKEWIDSLLRPGLHSRYDLVTPSHSASAKQRLASTNLLSPLLAGLFGSAPSQPMSGTFLVSAKLRRRLLSRRDWDGKPARYVPELWVNFSAAAERYRRAEAFVGESRSIAANAVLPAHAAVAQIVESTFSLMEQYESQWQGEKASDPLEQFGRAERVPASSAAEDGLEYVVRFVNAYAALKEQWRAILDPPTFQAIDAFHSSLRDGGTEACLHDAAWVRIVYEFAGAWKRRLRPRDQLAGLFVPLYWARIGSFLMKTRWAEHAEAEMQLGMLRNYFQGLRPALDRLWTGRSEAD